MTNSTAAMQAADDAAECLKTWLDAVREHGHRDAGYPDEGDVQTLLADRVRTAAELERVRRGATLPVLRQAWRNGWSDRARAVCDAVRVSDNERDAYERAFARYMSEDPAEADKDPYRPLDGPGDSAAAPTRPADGTAAPSDKRTPEQWGAEYDIQIADPDGWRNAGDLAWGEPITLPEYFRRAALSTSRGVTPDVWNRFSRDAHCAAEIETTATRPADGAAGMTPGKDAEVPQ